MNGHEQSDGSVVPEKPTNKWSGAPLQAESVEERDPAKGNAEGQTRDRTQSRVSLQQALDRVRRVAEKDKETQFTALWHHVTNPDRLREAYFSLKRGAAAGIDGVTWKEYGEELTANLEDLSGRLNRGAYRAKPVRRTMRKKNRGKLADIKAGLRRRLHWNPHDVGKWLRAVLLGHYQYYGVPLNYRSLAKFKVAVERLWFHSLRRRSQKANLTWPLMRTRWINRWLPPPRIMQPWPDQRLCVKT